MWVDPIVAEVRKARDEYAASFGYDIDRMIADLRAGEQEERARGRQVVSFPPKRLARTAQ